MRRKVWHQGGEHYAMHLNMRCKIKGMQCAAACRLCWHLPRTQDIHDAMQGDVRMVSMIHLQLGTLGVNTSDAKTYREKKLMIPKL
jgi:hypothetical protein